MWTEIHGRKADEAFHQAMHASTIAEHDRLIALAAYYLGMARMPIGGDAETAAGSETDLRKVA